jgi:hypothetical protein
MRINDPKFNIGDRVYHVTRESDEGVVVDINYSMRFGMWTYSVTFRPGSEDDFYEDEISNSKIY